VAETLDCHPAVCIDHPGARASFPYVHVAVGALGAVLEDLGARVDVASGAAAVLAVYEGGRAQCARLSNRPGEMDPP
jgi:hypothetical protein